MDADNLLEGIPDRLPEELFTSLLCTEGLRIERIVSQGHASPPGFWYDQPQHECVVLLEGSAAVEFDEPHRTVELRRGSWLNIPAHAKHRVAWTNPAQQTVWLAIHYER
ncbi:MAG: cupin [Planctomycetaceae bacterium]|nr:cupin [Planctomycetaceae bacterium]